MNFKIDKTPHSIPIAGLFVSLCVSQSCDTFDAHSCLVKEEEEMKEEEDREAEEIRRRRRRRFGRKERRSRREGISIEEVDQAYKSRRAV